jgi:hypothetical protein
MEKNYQKKQEEYKKLMGNQIYNQKTRERRSSANVTGKKFLRTN